MQRFVRTWWLAAGAATFLAAAVPASLIADAQGLDSTQLEERILGSRNLRSPQP